MVFSSLVFLFFFLPAFLLLYYLTPDRYRNWTALIGSLFFYSWGAPRFVLVLTGSALLDYVIANRVYNSASTRTRRGWVVVSIVCNLGLLAVFKYANFAVEEMNALLSLFGVAPARWTAIALPLGISFFTFHKITYVVDIYRGNAIPAPNFGVYLLYMLFFPQLIAGPIIRYHDVAGQLAYRRHSTDKLADGFRRFAVGLAKKVLIANTLGEVADAVFGGNMNAMTPAYTWLGVVAYAFQIYFDFSGYSDMAIGLARMCGFTFLENFNHPYIATSFTDFWKRWHISLSNFMREYLYIPLGGNRVSSVRLYVNLWIVFLLSGLWHGAAWQFVAWGAYNGLFLALDRAFFLERTKRLPRILTIAGTFFFLLIGWVFFRSANISGALVFLSRMFGITHASAIPPILPDIITNRAIAMLVIAAVLSFGPGLPARLREAALRWIPPAPRIVAGDLVGFLLLVMSACALVNANFNPFIYFRF